MVVIKQANINALEETATVFYLIMLLEIGWYSLPSSYFGSDGEEWEK